MGDLRRELRRGFLAMLPLWPGAVPFAVAFAVLARAAGFGPWETVASSLFIFAGSAQVATITLYAAGTPPIAIVATGLLLNLRHILYGLSLSRLFGPARNRIPTPLLASMMTDESYGVTVRDTLDGRGGPAFLVGASLSLWISFNLATAAGVVLGAWLPDPRGAGLDFIFPLTFVAVLVPLLRSPRHAAVALAAGTGTLAIDWLGAGGGVAVLASAVGAAALGAALDRKPTGGAES